MKVIELTKKYNLLGSLLENIYVDESKKTITLEIDFCYWLQQSYTEGGKETGVVSLVFSDYSYCGIDRHTINSDEIVKVETIDDTSIDICVESDLTGDYHHIKLSALNVEVYEKNPAFGD